MHRILGIDPGLVSTGYAVIESHGNRGGDAARLIASGVVSTAPGALPERLGVIFTGVGEIIREYRPESASVETVFVRKDPSAALKLGQARGAAVCAAVTRGVPVYEYDPRAIKKLIVGKGNAAKEQVQFMVARLLQVAARYKDDEADAMAIALCHAFSHRADSRLAAAIAASTPKSAPQSTPESVR